MRTHSRIVSVPALTAAVTILAGVLGGAAVTSLVAQSASVSARFEPPNGSVYLGVSTHLITAGVDSWDKAAGITDHPALYGRWTTPGGAFQPILDEAATRPGIAPIVHWNLPMDNSQITNGSQDAYISAQAAAVQAYGKPVFVRLDWEMNAYWYKHWNLTNVTPVEFVASWRRVVGLFAGVPNVAFVWSPNVGDYFSREGVRVATTNWYPGDDVVDWVGLDAYPQSAAPGDLLSEPDGMDAMAQFAADHHKPMMLAEWAPNLPHPDTADPINLVFDWAERYPSTVKALVYFDFVTQGRDFLLADHPVGAATFRYRAADVRYLHHLVGHGGGTTTTVPPTTVPPTTVPSSTSSPPTTGTPSTTVPSGLPAPTHLIGIQGYTSVALQWRPVSGAAGYSLYRDGAPVASSTGTSFDDTGLTNGQAYTWTVAAVDPSGQLSAPSDPFTITPGRWGTHDNPCTYGGGKPCRYPSEGPPPVP